MTIAERDAVHAAAALVTALGRTPSIRVIAAVIKAADGKRAVRWTTIAEALKCCPATVSATERQQPGNSFEHDGQQPGNGRATATRTRADLKGVSKTLPYGQGLLLASLGEDAPSGASEPVAPAARSDRRSPAEQVADSALDALRSEIEPRLTGMPWSSRAKGKPGGWRERNRRYAVQMAEGGLDVEAIVDAYYAGCERRGVEFIPDLRWVQEDLNRPSPAESDRLPTYGELLASGALDDTIREIEARRAAEAAVVPIRRTYDPRAAASILSSVPHIKVPVPAYVRG